MSRTMLEAARKWLVFPVVLTDESQFQLRGKGSQLDSRFEQINRSLARARLNQNDSKSRCHNQAIPH